MTQSAHNHLRLNCVGGVGVLERGVDAGLKNNHKSLLRISREMWLRTLQAQSWRWDWKNSRKIRLKNTEVWREEQGIDMKGFVAWRQAPDHEKSQVFEIISIKFFFWCRNKFCFENGFRNVNDRSSSLNRLSQTAIRNILWFE